MAEKPRTQVYRELTIEEISFVDKGANPDAHVLVLKADEIDRLKLKLTQAMRDRLFEAMDKATTPVELEEAFWREMSALRKAHPGELPKETTMDEKQVQAKIDEAVKAATKERDEQIATLKANAEELDGKVKELTQELETAKTEKRGDPDPYEGLSDTVRKRLEDADKEALAAKAAVEKMEQERAIEKRAHDVAKRFPSLPGPESVAGLFVRIEKAVGEEDGKALDELLSGLQAQIDTSELFKTAGRDPVDGDRGNTDPVAIVHKKAEQLIEKDSKLNFADAVQRVLSGDRKLYDRYRKASLATSGRSET